jgi:ketosteroid isomerase-like protein
VRWRGKTGVTGVGTAFEGYVLAMSTVEAEIAALEEGLRKAELGPDPDFFEASLADDAMFLSPGEPPTFAKAKVVEAHRSMNGQKFTNVEMRDMRILDHGVGAVVTCDGTYESPEATTTLRFLRVWLKKDAGWRIIAVTILPID